MKLTKTRPGITFILCSAALFIAMLAMPALLQAENTVQYKIGVLANSGKAQCIRQWQETARYLADKIPGASFSIIPLDFREADAAVKNREIDFIIANPSIYVDLEVRYGAQPIATIKNQMAGRSFSVFGGVIFTGADRSDINSLNDLRNKRFMAVDPDSFGGWLAAWRELKDHGIDPFRDFKEMKFSGTQDAVADAVKRGDVDAGTIRTDTLEHMVIAGKIDFKDFKLLNPVTTQDYNDQSFPLWLSTRLYPEWPLAKLKHTSLDLAEKVCIALLSMPFDDPAALTGRYNGWTVSRNYQPVHECLKELRYKPYEDFGRITFSAVLEKYWLLILATAILIVIMVLIINYMVALNRKLKQSQLIIQKEEENLRKSEQKFRSIIEESAEGIMLTDEQGMIIEWNRSIEQIAGFKRADVIGRPLWDVQFQMALKDKKTPEAYERLKTMLTGLLKNGEAPLLRQPIDWNIQHPDGTQRVVQTVTFSIKIGAGFMIVGFLLDTTERKAVEQQLVETKNYIENIIESSLDAIVVNDSTPLITQCNSYFLELLGYTKDEVLGRYMYDFTPTVGETYESTMGDTIRINDDFYNDSITMIGRLLETGKAANWQTYYLRRDGKVVPVEQNSFILKDTQGNIIGSAAIIRDITERKLAEKQLVETNDYLDNIIENSLDSIILSDNVGHISRCNKAFLSLVGYEQDEIIGKTMIVFLPVSGEEYESTTGELLKFQDDFYYEQTAMLEKMFETGMLSNWQTYILCKNNKVIPVEENIAYLLDKEGKRIGAVGILRDITERRRIETERERLIDELQKALVQVKTLSGFIPICSSCKKVRNDTGYWELVEAYISTRSEAEFSHSICPDCAQKLYPEIYAKISKDMK